MLHELCFLLGAEIQVLFIILLIRVILFWSCLLWQHIDYKAISQIVSLTLFSMLLHKCFCGNSVRDWEWGGRWWVVPKGSSKERVPPATAKLHCRGYGCSISCHSSSVVLSYIASWDWTHFFSSWYHFLPAWTPRQLKFGLWLFYCTTVFILLYFFGRWWFIPGWSWRWC